MLYLFQCRNNVKFCLRFQIHDQTLYDQKIVYCKNLFLDCYKNHINFVWNIFNVKQEFGYNRQLITGRNVSNILLKCTFVMSIKDRNVYSYCCPSLRQQNSSSNLSLVLGADSPYKCLSLNYTATILNII